MSVTDRRNSEETVRGAPHVSSKNEREHPYELTSTPLKLTEEHLVMVNLATDLDLQSEIETEAEAADDGKGRADSWVVIPRRQKDLASKLLREPKFEEAISKEEPTNLPIDDRQILGRPGTSEDVRHALYRQPSFDSVSAEPSESRNMSTSSLLSKSERCQCYCEPEAVRNSLIDVLADNALRCLFQR